MYELITCRACTTDCWASPWIFCCGRFGVGLEYFYFSQIPGWWQCCCSGEKTVEKAAGLQLCPHREMQPTWGDPAGRRQWTLWPNSTSSQKAKGPIYWCSSESSASRTQIRAESGSGKVSGKYQHFHSIVSSSNWSSLYIFILPYVFYHAFQRTWTFTYLI